MNNAVSVSQSSRARDLVMGFANCLGDAGCRFAYQSQIAQCGVVGALVSNEVG